MSESIRTVVHAVVVEEHVGFTLDDLCRACAAEPAQVLALVEEGVLEPEDGTPGEWRFAGPALRRARTALRLARDLDLGGPGTAAVMGLLDEIEALRARLRRAGLE